MVIECEAEKFKFSLGVLIKRLIKSLFVKRKYSDLNFNQWTIIDFDDCLKGNPHIQSTKE